MKIKKISQGFTFIEMLVVVVIIGILSAVGVANFRVANQKARDGRRQGDLEQIRAALEMYRTDQHQYPTTWPGSGGTLSADGTTYMEKIPTDPDSNRHYYYNSLIGSTYVLCAALELTTTGSCGGSSCGLGITCNYQITNPL